MVLEKWTYLAHLGLVSQAKTLISTWKSCTKVVSRKVILSALFYLSSFSELFENKILEAILQMIPLEFVPYNRNEMWWELKKSFSAFNFEILILIQQKIKSSLSLKLTYLLAKLHLPNRNRLINLLLLKSGKLID